MKKSIIIMTVFAVFALMSSAGGGIYDKVKTKQQYKTKAFMTGYVMYK